MPLQILETPFPTPAAFGIAMPWSFRELKWRLSQLIQNMTTISIISHLPFVEVVASTSRTIWGLSLAAETCGNMKRSARAASDFALASIRVTEKPMPASSHPPPAKRARVEVDEIKYDASGGAAVAAGSASRESYVAHLQSQFDSAIGTPGTASAEEAETSMDDSDAKDEKKQKRDTSSLSSSSQSTKRRLAPDVARPGETEALARYAAHWQKTGFGFIDESIARDYGLGQAPASNESSIGSDEAPKDKGSSADFAKYPSMGSSSSYSAGASAAARPASSHMGGPRKGQFSAFDEAIKGLCVGIEKIELEKKREQRIPTRAAMQDEMRQSTVSNGFRREQLIRESLDSMGLVRTKLQRQFHDRAILANAWWIHGDDFENDRFAIMEMYRVVEILCEILCITPRRNGKTTMVAMLAAALVYHIPGFRAAIFSTGRRASQALMDLMVTFLLKLPNGRSRIVRKNQEQLRLAPHPVTGNDGRRNQQHKYDENDANTSLVMSLPSSETGMNCVYVFVCCDCGGGGGDGYGGTGRLTSAAKHSTEVKEAIVSEVTKLFITCVVLSCLLERGRFLCLSYSYSFSVATTNDKTPQT